MDEVERVVFGVSSKREFSRDIPAAGGLRMRPRDTIPTTPAWSRLAIPPAQALREQVLQLAQPAQLLRAQPARVVQSLRVPVAAYPAIAPVQALRVQVLQLAQLAQLLWV